MEDNFAIVDLVSWSLLQCKTALVDNGDTLLSLFIAGVAGSTIHCLGMCGPFVFSQVASRLESVPANKMSEFHRLQGAALAPYHLGRATTYSALGGIAASASGKMESLGDLKWITPIMLVLGASFFISYALKQLKVPLPFVSSSKGRDGETFIGKVAAPFFKDPRGARGYALGIALGFLPCGLLYGALAAASSSGTALGGIFLMMAFALGTVPGLIVVGLLGQSIVTRWKNFTSYVAPLLLIANAFFLLYLAFKAM